MKGSPTLILNEQKAKSNIKKMATKARMNNIDFRPHFKTHQSSEISNWFKDEGVDRITCSSVKMAKYFADQGWNDITIAFPANALEFETIQELASKINLHLIFEDQDVCSLFNQKLKAKIGAFITIDNDYGRTGIHILNKKRIVKLVNHIESCENIELKGFLTHTGHSYKCRGKDEIMSLHHSSLKNLQWLKDEYPNLTLSIGDTPTCSVADSFGPADEIRPGNFIFYDLMQWQIGSCDINEIAVIMRCPIVSKHPSRNELVIYGGAVHFSKDSILDASNKKIFGQLINQNSGELIEGATITRLSQEHGVIHLPTHQFENFNVGDLVNIIPIHSCLTANLMKEYETSDGRIIKMMPYI